MASLLTHIGTADSPGMCSSQCGLRKEGTIRPLNTGCRGKIDPLPDWAHVYFTHISTQYRSEYLTVSSVVQTKKRTFNVPERIVTPVSGRIYWSVKSKLFPSPVGRIVPTCSVQDMIVVSLYESIPRRLRKDPNIFMEPEPGPLAERALQTSSQLQEAHRQANNKITLSQQRLES